jgi:predicted permease
MAGLLSDIRFALRQLRKARSFTFTVVVTLAVCIALNATIFAIVDAILFKPLAYPQPDRLGDLVTTYTTPRRSGFEDSQDGLVWQIATERVDAVQWAAYSSLSPGVTLVADAPRHVKQERVSASFFGVLGIAPTLGREFTRQEDREGGPAAVVLADHLWRSAFNADPEVVGRAVMLRGEPHTVVGVMPPGFRTANDADLWTPLRPSTGGEGEGQNYGVVARLKPGRTWAELDAQINAITDDALRHFHPSPDAHARLRVLPLQRVLTDTERKPLVMLWFAVLLVLLIGVANTAGLLLARAANRRHEFAIRAALGASRGAIARQLVAEALVLCAGGTVAGLALAYASSAALGAWLNTTFSVWQSVTIDTRVVGVTIALAVGATGGMALLAVWSSTRMRAHTLTGGRVAGNGHGWPRQLLVAGQVSLTMALLVIAAVLLRSFAHLRLADPGFDGRSIEAATVSLQDARYRTAASVVTLFDRTLERVRQTPGVESAAISGALPYERALNLGFRRMDGPGAPANGALTTVTYVTPGFFETLAIPIRSGRTVLDSDTGNAEPVALVNEAFVRRYLSGQEPLGSHLALAGTTRTVVGVAGDVQQTGWNSPLAALPAVYVPAAQLSDNFYRMAHVWFAPHWIVRTATVGAGIDGAVKKALADVDPNLVFTPFQRVDVARGNALALQRAEAALLTTFAIVALALAAIGAYGMIATMIAERRREFGIRLALGASVGRTVLRAAGPGLALVAIGVCIGAASARGVAMLLRSLVWGIGADDPIAFGVAAATLVIVTSIASALPALEVARLDPVETLRTE